MAEAFGIAGSAFGTASLGIQLFTEISNYLNSVEGRDEDLERAKNYALDFHSSLIALETLASTTGISDTDLERVINQGQANCATAISNLSKMVAQLKGQDPIPNSRTSKAMTLYVKLKYPFKKQNLESLEKQLFNTVSVLKFALTILQLRLRWCFTNRRASITDVDQYGQSIVDVITSITVIGPSVEYSFANEALPVFCMLAPFIDPAIHLGSKISSPLLAQLCQNLITPNPTVSGELISFLLSRCDDSAGQDCKSPFNYCSLLEQFGLVKGFPQISNYLEYGQLSRLVLMEDQDRVTALLGEHPASINEMNHLGQTPVHIAVQTQNATILNVLVNHADAKVSNAKDNNGHYAIDHAIDALIHARRYLEYLCDILDHVGYDLTKEHWIDGEAMRHFTFFILELRHTCCCFPTGGGAEPSGPLSTVDRREIEEEDSSLLERFEQLVTEFEMERGNYADLLSFAREYWAPRVEAVYREIESCVLTETQRQSAEALGVVWECYGPQLPLCGDDLRAGTENEEEIQQDQVLYRKGQ
ncbi:hypothetical protein FBULB1_13024 [Fusarium bulbicola]|nr:hypothetical protein FBULB1_13024 [Fusarium bulbicola]